MRSHKFKKSLCTGSLPQQHLKRSVHGLYSRIIFCSLYTRQVLHCQSFAAISCIYTFAIWCLALGKPQSTLLVCSAVSATLASVTSKAASLVCAQFQRARDTLWSWGGFWDDLDEARSAWLPAWQTWSPFRLTEGQVDVL